jgi:hypothetical protein
MASSADRRDSVPSQALRVSRPIGRVLVGVRCCESLLCVFGLMPGHSSGVSRAGIPVHAGTRFRGMPGRGAAPVNHHYRDFFPQGRRSTAGQQKLPLCKIREVLLLKAEGFSDRQIGAAIGSARSTVQEFCVGQERPA